MMHSSIPQQLVSTTCCFKSRRLLALGIALGVSSVTSAVAGNLHARATLDGIPSISFASHSGTAHAERVTGSRFCKVTERATYNDMNCNAGSGHAHHHRSISFSSLALDDDGEGFIDLLPSAAPPPPRPGLSGTSLYVVQTWLPNPGGDEITVAWSPDSFLQVDLSELTPGSRLASRASLNADGGLVGSVELSAWLNNLLIPQTDVQLFGIFDGLPFELSFSTDKVLSLQFRQPLSWTIAGNEETFDVSLDGSIGDAVDGSVVPEPNTALLVGSSLVSLLDYVRRRRQCQRTI